MTRPSHSPRRRGHEDVSPGALHSAAECRAHGGPGRDSRVGQFRKAADAGREIDRYLAEVRAGPRPSAVPNALVNAAYIDVLTGRRDAAVARLSEALRLPAGMFISRTLLRTEASWAPLRGHPGFERLAAESPSRS